MSQPALAVTMGDPAGIGPEIVLKALLTEGVTEWCRPVVVGHLPSLERDLHCVAEELHLRQVNDIAEARFERGVVNVIVPDDLADTAPPQGRVTAEGGAIAVACIRKAATLAIEGSVSAMVTAPINKAAMHAAGHLYAGHTELLAELAGVKDFSLVLTADDLHVFHVTTHMALREACETVSKERVLATIRLAHRFAAASGQQTPTIAVLGLNPHASEGGLFGREDVTEVEPAVRAAQELGIDALGPLPGDTAMPKALHGAFRWVVAMYHDQGHIPFKAVHLDRGVNVTVGLPWLRTSVDHGTAFDIAGTGHASEESLLSAMQLAARLGPDWPDVGLADL